MRIAILAPVYTPILPRRVNGGVELFTHLLTSGLAERGHKVTLFTMRDSRCAAARLVRLPFTARQVERSVTLPDGKVAPAPRGKIADDQAINRLVALLVERRQQFDVVINNSPDWYTLTRLVDVGLPIITRIHTTRPQKQVKKIGVGRRMYFVANSQTTKRFWRSYLPISRVIYNGLDVEAIAPGSSLGNYLVWAGRIAPHKGADLAIAVARRSRLPLVLAGRIQDRSYFAQSVKPKLSQQIRYLGFLTRPRLFKVLRGALVCLQTARVAESFGNLTVEALASGTPVIGFRSGATPEIVRDGVTGYLVRPGDVPAASRAAGKVSELSRKACRRSVETRFSVDRMVRAYESYLKSILNKKS